MNKIGFILFIISIACNGQLQKKTTPKEFINRAVINSNYFRKDSTFIIGYLFKKMKNHQESFVNKEYFDSTILEIDSIIYSHSLNEIAVLVIAKNPVDRNPYMDSRLSYYYNANCYLGKRLYNDSSIFELKVIGPFNLVNFDDKNEIRHVIRESYFLELSTVLDENGKKIYEYNLNDSRFWDSYTGWKRVFN